MKDKSIVRENYIKPETISNVATGRSDTKDVLCEATKITREWIQHTCINGDTVTWGSNDKIDMTVNKLEHFAFHLISRLRDKGL